MWIPRLIKLALPFQCKCTQDFYLILLFVNRIGVIVLKKLEKCYLLINFALYFINFFKAKKCELCAILWKSYKIKNSCKETLVLRFLQSFRNILYCYAYDNNLYFKNDNNVL